MQPSDRRAGPDRPSLILKIPGLQDGLVKLFKELRQPAKQEQFITSPMKEITRLLPGVRLSASEVSNANRFLFSVLANEQFRTWAHEYQSLQIEKFRANPKLKLDRTEVMQDLANAYAKFGDQNLLLNLVNPLSARATAPRSVAISHYIHTTTVLLLLGWAVIAVALTVIDFTPFTRPAEDFNFALSPAEMRALAEQLVTRSKQLSDSGVLFDPNARLP